MKGESAYRAGLAAISVALWTYVALRAARLALTFDECVSFVNARYLLDLQFHAATTANTHPLNTLWMILATSTIGHGEFALRLGSVLAFGGFLFGAAGLAATLRPRALGLLAFVLLTTNPFALEFFSLARGYGPAVAFETLSLACFVRWMSGRTVASKRGALLFGALAVLSNYTFVYYHAGLIGILALVELRDGTGALGSRLHSWIRGNKIELALNGVLFAFLAAAIRLLVVTAQLYFGGRTGFWSDTVGSLTRAVLYDRGLARMDGALAWAVVLALGLGALLTVMRRESGAARSALALLGILGAAVAGPVVAKALFGSLLPVERTALFYLPLVGAFLVSVLGVASAGRARIATLVVAGTASAGAIMHLFTSANPGWTYSWRFDARTKEVMHDLALRYEEGQRVRLGVLWLLLPACDYYRDLWGLDQVETSMLGTPATYDLERPEYDLRFYGEMTPPRPSFEIFGPELERDAFDALYVTSGVWRDALQGNVDARWVQSFADSEAVALGLR